MSLISDLHCIAQQDRVTLWVMRRKYRLELTHKQVAILEIVLDIVLENYVTNRAFREHLKRIKIMLDDATKVKRK